MSYPQQPGNWSDPSWPTPQPGYGNPSYPVSGQPVGKDAYPVSGYPPQYGYPVPPTPTTNGMAIAALVCSLIGLATCISAPVGAILGHVARRQIRERGEAGDGMALAGIIIGWIVTGLYLLAVIGYIALIAFVISADTTTSTY
ncbi:DUF4190 domain-containing protein [Polymorphospora rubra]|uniref:DUF4190 domain-containing protein n=1 Tax=Polymorphospora rubra TaxID=338584 RepID=A0A810MY83_9ACTN|nr:DUF4190 domain-containing protein [Polymorphospora rubra]BCJ66211.1 hypothetical protein Prubr_32320 [Polymorphospora rubra]